MNVCPECEQGKHLNCTMEVLAEDDTWVGCGCTNAAHVPPPLPETEREWWVV